MAILQANRKFLLVVNYMTVYIILVFIGTRKITFLCLLAQSACDGF